MSEEESSPGTLEPMVLVKRESWGAVAPKTPAAEMNFPLPFVVVSFMTGTPLTKDTDECKEIMQNLQKRNMEEDGLPDIAYSFVVGGDGKVYEGSGWTGQPCNPSFPEYHGKRLDVGYMGNLDRDNLPWEMYKAAIQLFSNGVDSGLLHEDWNCTEDPDTQPPIELDDD